MSTLKLVLNPYEPNYKSVGDLTLMVHAPYSKVGLTAQSEPHLEDIIPEKPEAKSRTVILAFCDPTTPEVEFNLDGQSTHAIHTKGKDYLIALQEIGEEETPQEPGRKYLYFNFDIQEIK
jgi:hypothetical protein